MSDPGRHASDGAEIDHLEVDGLRRRALVLADQATAGDVFPYAVKAVPCPCDECAWVGAAVALLREVAAGE